MKATWWQIQKFKFALWKSRKKTYILGNPVKLIIQQSFEERILKQQKEILKQINKQKANEIISR